MQIEPPVPCPPKGLSLHPEHLTQPLDVSSLAVRLEQQGLHLDPAVTPRQFSGGLANINYLIRLNSDWAVLRRPPSSSLPPGANDMTREHRILSVLWRGLPLAPRSFYLDTDTSIIGVPYQILEFRSGLALRGDTLDPLLASPELGNTLSHRLITTLSHVHATDLDTLGLGTLGRPEGFFQRQTKGWLDRANYITNNNPPLVARQVADWLQACTTHDDNHPVLLHSDFKLDNLLLDPDTLQVTTLLDWDMGTRGPAMYDLATMLSYWTEANDPDCMHKLAQMPTAQPGFMQREEAAMAYAALTGRDIGNIRAWRVQSIFKLAVVFLQLHRRHVIGETSDPRYATFGELGHDLFSFALDVAHERLF